ncbi:MAG TPA: hypothetical protein VK172_10435 [Lentimicrobium sp.]|nr:hypothetical protein [Lentimicrobium sp.]
MKETAEEKFARISAENLYGELCESDGFHQDDEVPEEFISEMMVKYESEIKDELRKAILDDLQNFSHAFTYHPDKDEYTYDDDLREDYEGIVTLYIREKFFGGKTKKLLLCKHCGSDNVEMKAWVKPNQGNKFSDFVSDQEGDDNYCLDCGQHGELLDSEIKYTAEVEGFQVVGIDGTDKEGDIHPDMQGSFCLYNLSQAREMIAKNPNEWRLLTLWTGDVEEPTLMFEGNPRE